ncbi:MAG: YdcF family protein [Alistipes sp.]|nr:YdcF family protein [Alistipes sp.]
MVIAILFFALFIWFLLPLKAGIVSVGNVFGALFSGGAGIALLFRRYIHERSVQLWQTGIGKAVIIAVIGIFAAGIILAAVISAFMIKEIHDKPKNGNTTLVVLGCQVRGDQPSQMLRRRLDAAYGFLAENGDVKVIVSGGQGSDEEISEALCMRNYLVSRGISEDRIIMEDKSTDTRENIRFSKAIIEEQGLPADITIVTDGYHQLRADIFARQEGLRAYNISASTALWLLPTYWVREWLGIAYYTFLGSR